MDKYQEFAEKQRDWIREYVRDIDSQSLEFVQIVCNNLNDYAPALRDMFQEEAEAELEYRTKDPFKKNEKLWRIIRKRQEPARWEVSNEYVYYEKEEDAKLSMEMMNKIGYETEVLEGTLADIRSIVGKRNHPNLGSENV